ncbi:hypothetical protein [uncultured Desulfovibrio sp.]|uniref:hypothetical protein n=1 Tax=uncultured Desulfovibrio sp. TaxID=167968 RepID=UPI0026333DB1|nr:hypothetical protein [uncultured Desulfovibrio sp.]
MSQQQMEQPAAMDEQQQQAQQQVDDYASALDDALQDGDDGQQKPAEQQKPEQQDGGRPAGEQPRQEAPRGEPTAPQQTPDGQPQQLAQPAPYQPQPVTPPYPQPQPVMPPQQPQGQQPRQEQPKPPVEIPEAIKDEWEALKKASPEAAALAQEDSPEGQQIRDRLAEYGADLASDRAAVILGNRSRDIQAQQADAARARQNVEAHNQHFQSVLQRDHPDYVALLSDPSRRAEAQAKVQDIFNWIGTLPYAEGAKLMPIAQSGRNPEEVSALLTRYERERGGGKPAAAQQRRPDPTGALAVPGRGGTVAPAGVGDKDDFDAALDAGLSSEK